MDSERKADNDVEQSVTSNKGIIEINQQEFKRVPLERKDANGHQVFSNLPTSNIRRYTPQVLATMTKNLILLGYGMTLGFPTIVIPSVSGQVPPDKADFLRLNMDQISWFSSINLLCVPIGCLFSGTITQPIGRKKSMLFLNVPFLAAWIIYHNAGSITSLYTALAITGLTGGILEAPVLTYVAEITEPSVRGWLSATSSACVILGIFIQFLVGSLLHWRKVALFNMVFPVAAICALLFVPESPHWLIGEGRIDEARKSLQWLRGWVKEEEVEDELSEVVSAMKNRPKIQHFFSPKLYTQGTFLRPFGLVTFIFFVGHLGGMTVLQTYAVSIFAEVGSPLDKYTSTVVLGLVELIGALVCVSTIKYLGKRKLAVWSTLIGGLLLLAVSVNTKLRSPHETSYLPLVGLAGFAFSCHICLRLLPWILIGEVYTSEVRATASGLSGGAGYILGFAANKSYLYLVNILDVWATLVSYSVVTISGAGILYFILPETEGLTLAQIQRLFERKKTSPDNVKEDFARDNDAYIKDSHL